MNASIPRSALLLALAANFSASAQQPAFSAAGTTPISTAWGVVHVERITVRPESPDDAPGTKNRWVKFEEALGPGRTAQARYHTYAWRGNDGSRVECYEPCFNDCCIRHGGFSLLEPRFGK